MTTDFLELATTLKYLGAKWLLEKKVNFTPCNEHEKFKLPVWITEVANTQTVILF